MTMDSSAYGLAAFTLCEAMVLAMVDGGKNPHQDIYDALEDAIDAHREIARAGKDKALHVAAARLIESFLIDLNAVSRPKNSSSPSNHSNRST